MPRLGLRSVLDLAPVYGRNSEMLLPLVREDPCVVNAIRLCLAHVQARFADHAGYVRLRFNVDDGASLSMIAPASVTFVDTFNSMAPFDESLTSTCSREFAWVLAPGGTPFLHHANTAESTRRLAAGPGTTRRGDARLGRRRESGSESRRSLAGTETLRQFGAPGWDHAAASPTFSDKDTNSSAAHPVLLP